MLTYNQEDFIGQTIESVLAQKTNFNYQLVIGEDLSSDSTRAICEKYANQFPDKIKLLPSLERLGLINNFIRTIKECDGKYIAVLDGDDYWTDPFKLQKQFDFLESHPDYSIVYTGLRNLFPSGEVQEKRWPEIKGPLTFDDLIFGNFIPSVTAFYCNKQFTVEIPSWTDQFPYGDWPIYLWLTRNGDKIGYIDEITGVYRKEIGVSERMKKVSSDIAKVNLGIVKCVYEDNMFLPKKNKVRQSLLKHKYSLLGSYFREGKYLKSLVVAKDLFFEEPVKVLKTYLYLAKRKMRIKT